MDNEIYNLGAKPVNVIAARLLWKAPWWAKAPPDRRRKIRKGFEKINIEDITDCYRPPPKETEDRRGIVIICNDGFSGVITGFCEKVEKMNRRPRKRGKNPFFVGDTYFGENKEDDDFKIERRHYIKWWVLMEDGSFTGKTWWEPSKRRWAPEPGQARLLREAREEKIKS